MIDFSSSVGSDEAGVWGGMIEEGNKQYRDVTRHSEGKMGGRKRAEEEYSEEGRDQWRE